jgi:glycosyltransferase involved in cell wall biosynthesis
MRLTRMHPARRRSAAGFADLRLAVVSPFVDRRHGTERALAELLERLARDYGCEVHLYAQRVEDLRLAAPETLTSGEGLATNGPNVGSIHWHRVPAIPGPHLVQFMGWILLNGFWRRRDAWLGRTSCDLLFSPGINCLRPDVVVVHALFHRLRDLAEESDKEPQRPGGILRRWHRRIYYALLTVLERRVYSNRNIKLAAVSRRTARLLEDYCRREDVAIVPNGVDTAQFSPEHRLARREEARRARGLRGDECVLLLIGNDWRTKGLPTVLEAMAGLSHLPLRLLVMGTDARDYFQKQAERLGLRERCAWEGPDSDVLDLYAAADIYVSPSREDSFGLPVAEAMACGLPVITSRFAGVADFVQDGVDGFVLEDPQDMKQLAQCVARLVADSELRQHLGEAAVRKATGFTWDGQASGVWQLLQGKVRHDAIAKR